MVLLLKRSYDNGRGVPAIPRSTRSTRKRGSVWRKAEVSKQKCAFDLLATVAGNLLLQEGQNSPSSSTKDSIDKEEQNAQETTSEEQCRDRCGLERSFFLSELVAKEQICYNDHRERETWPSVVTTISDCSDWLELGSLNRKRFEFGKERNDNQRNLKDYPFKKRKLYDDDDDHKNSMSISEIGHYNEDASSYALTLPTAHLEPGTSSSLGGEGASFRSNESSRVKLRIKSFRIPELFIEIQESATVGSLKRTVMEAVTSVLGNGLRVGVLLQGKKVRDDTKTLLQSGIRQDDNAVGFTLEPIPAQDSPHPKDARHVTNTMNLIGSGAPTSSTNDVGALVAFPRRNNMGGRALVVAAPPSPMRRPRRPETAQRRIRRPFTVSEVESLVQAVEKLGTGRWRDVKLRAFDNAKHRTYVDLKDKWKTLVHTARISPQQRRGEPVPQELLDRVLTAHSYWSQRQHHSPTAFLI